MMTSKKKTPDCSRNIRLLKYYEKENASSRALSDKFLIGRTQATGLIKNKDTVLKLWKSKGNDEMKTKKRRKTKSINNNINNVVYEWFLQIIVCVFGFFYALYISVIWKYCTSIICHYFRSLR